MTYCLVNDCVATSTRRVEFPRALNLTSANVDVRFGSKADIDPLTSHVRFTPKADIGTQPRNVRFVPKADIGLLTHVPTVECVVRKPPSVTTPTPRAAPA